MIGVGSRVTRDSDGEEYTITALDTYTYAYTLQQKSPTRTLTIFVDYLEVMKSWTEVEEKTPPLPGSKNETACQCGAWTIKDVNQYMHSDFCRLFRKMP